MTGKNQCVIEPREKPRDMAGANNEAPEKMGKPLD